MPAGTDLGFEMSDELSLEASTPRRTCDVALHAGGSARVLVVDQDGRALPGVPLVLQEESWTLNFRDAYLATDEKGVFLLEGLRPGTYQVRAELPGYRAATREFTCRIGLQAEVEITLRKED
jgi:hypothetical protein